jgi:hypothetical protein
MPCSDITEVLRLELDAADRLRSYALNKRTCGAPIGDEALLLPQVAGADLEALLTLSFDEVLAGVAPGEEFLVAKHLVALQEAAAVLLGRAPTHPEAACTTVSLAAEGEALAFEALVRVDALAHKIKACGNCKRCGSR